MPDNEGSKLIIDSDWKSQAQAEKERLAEQTQAGKPAGETPEPDVIELVRMLVEPALLYLGRIADPSTGRAVVSLEAAKFYIDLLGVLEAKTKGNLSAEEAATVSTTLRELRADFVEVSRLVARAVAEGKLKPASGSGSISSPAASPATPTSPSPAASPAPGPSAPKGPGLIHP